MKKLLPLLLFAVLASCGGKEAGTIETDNVLQNLTFSVDTMLIDSGEGLFNLSGTLHLSYQSPNLLYLFDEKLTRIQKVDLDKRALVSTFHFEKEGPNGTGTNLSNLQSLAQDRFLIVSNEAQGIYKADGTKELNLGLANFSDPENDSEPEIQLPFEMQISADGNFAYAIVGDFFEGNWSFVRINLEGKSLKTWDMPEFLNSRKFTIMLNGSDSFDLHAEDIHLNKLNEKVAVTAGNTSSIYLYDPSSDSLSLVTFPHEITATEKTGTYPLEVTSTKEYDNIITEIKSEITYGTFIWDSSREKYFRIGYKSINDYKKYEVFLYAYDKKLNLIGEQKVEGLNKIPSHYFFKDGKLYSYVNVEDELGFAVFTFDF
ncbi:DUF4221 family protein [Algoriphagus chordae]|uniref:Uncharacterized protein DUF4221 n=1 Tax=Algoriphagus chordae TaxID=237019 RepID=A0A2W7R8S0_9BACT|nr:DUF4221 family protein [Algoriphagus chordae]PZX47005.1 uncharacterized protein DUF4221 [Algoriphagus chordae]